MYQTGYLHSVLGSLSLRLNDRVEYLTTLEKHQESSDGTIFLSIVLTCVIHKHLFLVQRGELPWRLGDIKRSGRRYCSSLAVFMTR